MTYAIITKKNCPWCVKAKDLLDLHRLDWVEFSIETDPAFRAFLKVQDLHTVPQVFIGGNLIGGYEDLEKKLNG